MQRLRFGLTSIQEENKDRHVMTLLVSNLSLKIPYEDYLTRTRRFYILTQKPGDAKLIPYNVITIKYT